MGYDFVRETKEAVYAGERALESLKSAKKELSSAKNWGIYDLLGGGFVSTLIKHSKMDRAQEYLEQAKHDLNSFSRELQDVNMSVNLDIESNDFLKFADWFFDGVVADWLVQNRINEARGQVDEAIQLTEQVLAQLSSYL